MRRAPKKSAATSRLAPTRRRLQGITEFCAAWNACLPLARRAGTMASRPAMSLADCALPTTAAPSILLFFGKPPFQIAQHEYRQARRGPPLVVVQRLCPDFPVIKSRRTTNHAKSIFVDG